MSSPLNLSLLLNRGRIFTETLTAYGGVVRPTDVPIGKHWIILGGVVVTAGANVGFLQVIDPNDNAKPIATLYSKTAAAAGAHPLFSTDGTDFEGTQWTPLIITEGLRIGGAMITGDYVVLTILEW